MVYIKSFLDVLYDYYNNKIFENLSSYIEDNPSEIDCSSYDVECTDEASLEDFEIKRVNIKEAPNNKLDFDVVVAAELIIAETVIINSYLLLYSKVDLISKRKLGLKMM